MTFEEALAGARRLQAEADSGWPDGFSFDRVLAEARCCLAALSAEVALDPRKSREIISALNSPALIW